VTPTIHVYRNHLKIRNYPSMFTSRLHDQPVNTRRILWQTRNGQTVVTRYHLTRVLPRKLCLRLQPTNQNTTILLLYALNCVLHKSRRHIYLSVLLNFVVYVQLSCVHICIKTLSVFIMFIHQCSTYCNKKLNCLPTYLFTYLLKHATHVLAKPAYRFFTGEFVPKNETTRRLGSSVRCKINRIWTENSKKFG